VKVADPDLEEPGHAAHPQHVPAEAA
jgi:hypothetical protein